MMKEKKIRIYISCHKDTDYIKTDIMKPIQLGCAKAKMHIPGMLYDDQGINISELNPLYCELTAQYWAWKNEDCDYYGFCHYRRYFSFSNKKYPADAYGNVIEECIDDVAAEKYGLNDKTISELVTQYDVITTPRLDIKKTREKSASVTAQYEQANLLHAKDIHTMLDIIDEKFPEFSKVAHQHCEGHITSFCNMYILRKEVFCDYCEWLFAILEEFCKRTDMSRYSTEALRTPGHLAERLFGIYYLYLKDKHPEFKFKELQCVKFENTNPQEVMKPAFAENSIPIAFAANNNFVPMFSTCLESLIRHSNKQYNYDIILVQTDVTLENKTELMSQISSYNNISLRFFDATKLVSRYNLKANAHISVETYYRFLVQDILPDYDKILYLDCDIIVNGDVAELYHVDMDGYMIGAVHDVDFLGQINGANKETLKYIQTEFCMKNAYDYFQAGVLLLNESEMRKAYSLNQWLTFASTPYKYNDQDVLNLYCEGKVKFLDMRWNLITDCDHTRISNVVVYAPDYIQKEYFDARKHPKIIHYAGFMKPWHRPTEDMAHYFWEYARYTPFYEELLFRLMDGVSYWAIYENNKRHNGFLGKIKRLVIKMRDIILPYGSVRREKVKKILGR